MTTKRVTVILYGCNRNLWRGGALDIQVTDLFAAQGPKPLYRGTTDASTLDLVLELPFDAGQVYGLLFSTADHRPAWHMIRRTDFIRQPDNVEGDALVLRLMLLPDDPGTSDVASGFKRLQESGSPMTSGLDATAFEALAVPAKMVLLNIEAKLRATLVDTTPLISFVKAVRHVAVDRVYLDVDASLKDRIARSADFGAAAGHKATKIPGIPAHPDSWKHRRFAGGNVQLSFSHVAGPLSESDTSPVHSVDADIDLGKGLAHAAEWLDNNVIRPGHKTNQSLVYGLLYAQNILPLYTLDPLEATTSRAITLVPVRTPRRPSKTRRQAAARRKPAAPAAAGPKPPARPRRAGSTRRR